MGDEDAADGCEPRGMDLRAEEKERFVLRKPGWNPDADSQV